jgi:hypothetical protein
MPSTQSWHAEFDAKQKQLEPLVQRAVDRVRAALAARDPKISSSFFYGAIGIDPKHLVIWFIFATDVQKEEAEKNGLLGELDRKSRDALREEGYPPLVLGSIFVSFASDEEIKRGGGYAFFK